MATKTTKLAGPDADNCYKVLQVKGHLLVKPGEVYTERHVVDRLLRAPHIDTTIIEAKFTGRTRTFLNAMEQPVA